MKKCNLVSSAEVKAVIVKYVIIFTSIICLLLYPRSSKRKVA